MMLMSPLDQSFDAITRHLSRPVMVVLSGPSGSGKSTLIHRFIAGRDTWTTSISATTRAPRPGEQEGVDYFFLSQADFARRREAGAFLESAQVFGRDWYGTPRAAVDACLADGLNVIMDIDVQGAAQLRCSRPEAIRILVLPPDAASLERRLRGRGTERSDDLERRLATAAVELAQWHEFHYLVINDDLDDAVAQLAGRIDAARSAVAGRQD